MTISGATIGQASRHGFAELCLTTQSGVIGTALVEDGPAAAAAIQLANACLLSEDPRAVCALHVRLQMAIEDEGVTAQRAAAALDCALWDAKSRAQGVPLWRLLGGDGRSLPIMAATASTVCPGMIAAQLDLANVTSTEIANAADLLRRSTSAPTVLLKANAGWTAKEAERRLSEFERQNDIAYVELPSPAWQFEDYAALSQSLTMGIAVGRQFGHRGQFYPFLQARAADLFLLNIATLGVTGSVAMADAIWGLELPVIVCSSPGDAAIQVASALPNCMFIECDSSNPAVEGGRVSSGSAPGINWGAA